MANGKSGAPKGNGNARKGSRWRNMLEEALEQYEDMPNGVQAGKALKAIAMRTVADALCDDPRVRAEARSEIANRLDGKPKETIDATFTNALAQEMTDAELLDIARGRSNGAAEATQSTSIDPAIH